MSLTPILQSTPGSPPTYNVGMAETFSWIPVDGASRSIFARASYLVNPQDITDAIVADDPNKNGFTFVDSNTTQYGNYQSIKVLSACQFSGLTALNTTVGNLTGYQLPQNFEFIADIRSFKLAYGSVIAYNSENTYPITIRNVYPNAILAETFGARSMNFIQSQFGYTPNNIVLAESICSDDVDAPIFSGNIGQFPNSMTSYLGPFMAGGLAGYPHTGVVGLVAWISHATTATNGALFLYSAPHIGITFDGVVGSMKRRGQNGALSTTCGAVGAAISSVIDPNAVAPTVSNYSLLNGSNAINDYQQFTLTSILWNNRNVLLATAASDRMRVATEMIRAASFDWIKTNLPTAYALAGSTVDVFVCTGTFINADDGYDAYIDTNTFAKYNGTSGWLDYSATFTNSLAR